MIQLMHLLLVNVVRAFLDGLDDIFEGRVSEGLISHLHLHDLRDQTPLGQSMRDK